jgi:ankyrin repeat protein
MQTVSENTKNNTSNIPLRSFSKNNTYYFSNKSVRTKRQVTDESSENSPEQSLSFEEKLFLKLSLDEKRSVLGEKILFQGREKTVREVVEVPIVDSLLDEKTLSDWQLKILAEIAARRKSPIGFRYLSIKRTEPFTGKEVTKEDLRRAFKSRENIFVLIGPSMAQAERLFDTQSICEYSEFNEAYFKERLLRVRVLLLGEGTRKKNIERFKQVKNFLKNIKDIQIFLIHREPRMLVIGSLPPHIENPMTYRDIREPVTVQNLREAFKDEENLFALSGVDARRAAEIFDKKEAGIFLFFDLNHKQHDVFLTQRIVVLEGGDYGEDEDQFKTLCAYYPDRRIHLVREKSGQLTWQRYRDPDFYPERNFRQPVLRKDILLMAARSHQEKYSGDPLRNMVFAVQGIRRVLLETNFGLPKNCISTQIPVVAPGDSGPFIFILSNDQTTAANHFEQLKKTFSGEGKELHWLKADSTGEYLFYYHSPENYRSLLPYIAAEHLLFQEEFSKISTKLLIFADEREQERTTSLTAAIQQRLNNPEHANDWAIRIYLPDISSDLKLLLDAGLSKFNQDVAIGQIVNALADSKGLGDFIARSLLAERLKFSEDDNRARVVIIFNGYQDLDLPPEKTCLFFKYLQQNTRAVFWITVDDLFLDSVTYLQQELSDNIYILAGINKNQATKYLEYFWKKELALKLTQGQLTNFPYQDYINELFKPKHFSRSYLDLSELRILAEVLASDVQRLSEESEPLFELDVKSERKFKRTEHAQLISDFVQLRFEKLKLRHDCPTDCKIDIQYFTKKLSLIALNKIFGFDEKVIELFFPKLNEVPETELDLRDAVLGLLLLSPEDVIRLNEIGLVYSEDNAITKHNTIFLHDEFINYFAVERIGDKMQSAMVDFNYDQQYKNKFFNFIFQYVLNVKNKKSLRDMFNHYLGKNIKFKALFSQRRIASIMALGLVEQVVTGDLFSGLYLAIEENLFHIVDFITIGAQTDANFGKAFLKVILKKPDPERGDGLLHALAHYDRPNLVPLLIGSKIAAIGSPSEALIIKNKGGGTPLHTAVYYNRISVIKAFFDPLQNEMYGRTAENLGPLLNVFKTFNKNGDSPIHMAVREGSEGMLEAFLEALRGKAFEAHRTLQKRIILFPNVDGDSVLGIAVKYNQVNKIEIILNYLNDHNPDFVEPIFTNGMILHLAAQTNELSIVNTVLKFIKNPSLLERLLKTEDVKGDTPLHLSVRANNLPVVQALLRKAGKQLAKELLLKPNRFGKLPLHHAVNGAQLDMIEALLNGSDDQEVIAKQLTYLDDPTMLMEGKVFSEGKVPSNTPLSLALHSIEVFKALLHPIKDKSILRTVLLPPEIESDSILIQAIKFSSDQVVKFLFTYEDQDLLKELLSKPKLKGERILFPLHYALSLSKSSDEITVEPSQTILACNKRIIAHILGLIKSNVATYGDILLLTDDRGDTALHIELGKERAQYAISIFKIVENHSEILKKLLLIKNIKKYYGKNAWGRTVLQVAISSGHKTHVELFLNALRSQSSEVSDVQNDYPEFLAKQLRVTDHAGQNALHIAAKRAHCTIMMEILNKFQYLSKEQISNILSAKDPDKRTPFETAISIGFLTDRHRQADKDKLSIIHKLVKVSDSHANTIAEFLKTIKKQNKKLYDTLLVERGPYLSTPIHYAAVCNHEKTFEVLFNAMSSSGVVTETWLKEFSKREHKEWALAKDLLGKKNQILQSLADDLLGFGKGMLHLAIKAGNLNGLKIMLEAFLENMVWRDYVVEYKFTHRNKPDPDPREITQEEKDDFLNLYKGGPQKFIEQIGNLDILPEKLSLFHRYYESINSCVLDEAMPGARKMSPISPLMQVIVSQGKNFDVAISMIDPLINSGVDVDLVNKKGLSALTLAVERKYFRLAEWLIVERKVPFKQLTYTQLLELQDYARKNKENSKTLMLMVTVRLQVLSSCFITTELAGPSSRMKRDVKCILAREELENIRSTENKKLYPELNLEHLEVDLEKAAAFYATRDDEARRSFLKFLGDARFTRDTNKYTQYVKQLDETSKQLQRAEKLASWSLAAGKVAGDVLVTRTLIVHLLEGDWDDVGIDLAFLFSGPALMKAHELVAEYTEELLSAPEQLKWLLTRMKLGHIADQLIRDSKLLHEALFRQMLHKALTTSMRCLSSWTLPFMIYQLASDIKQLKNQIDPKARSATERAIAIDSLFVALDGLSFVVGMGELMGLLAGVSELLGPLGLVGLGAMLAMQLYEATEYVQQIEETVHLDTQEKVRTWLRTLALMPPEIEVQERLTLAQGYKALIQQILNLFGNHPEIASYTTPGLVAQGHCNAAVQAKEICRSRFLNRLMCLFNPLINIETQIYNQYAKKCEIPLVPSKGERYIERYEHDEDGDRYKQQVSEALQKIGLQEIKYDPLNGTVICFASDVPGNQCRNAIVFQSNKQTETKVRHHIIALGAGGNNTVRIKHQPGSKTLVEMLPGSNQDYDVRGDVTYQLFTPENSTNGVIEGRIKADPQVQETTLDFSGFALNKTVQVKMQGIEGFVTHEGYPTLDSLLVSGIRIFIGRAGDTDRIELSEFCGSFRIYGGGGYAGYQPGPAPDDWSWKGYARGMDEITISSGNCPVNGTIAVGSRTSVFVENIKGTLNYVIQTERANEKNSDIYFTFNPEHAHNQSQHNFNFNQIKSPEEIRSIELYGLPNQISKLDFQFTGGAVSIISPPAGGRYIFPFMEVKVDQNKKEVTYSPISLAADEYQSVSLLVETYQQYSKRFNTIVMGTRALQDGDQTLKETIITTVDPHKVLPTDPTADIVHVYGDGIYSLTPRKSESRIAQQIIIYPNDETESKTLIIQAVTTAIEKTLDSRATVKMSIQPSVDDPQDLELKIFVDRNTIGASKLPEDVRYIVRLKQGVQWYSHLEIIDGEQNVADRNGRPVERIAQQRALSVRYDQNSQSYVVELKPLRRTPGVSLWVPTLSKNAVIDLSDKEQTAFKFFKLDEHTLALIEIHPSADRPLMLLFHKNDPYLSGLNLRFNQSTKEISVDEILSEAGDYRDYRYTMLQNLFEEIVNENASQRFGKIASQLQHLRQYQAQPKVLITNVEHQTGWQSIISNYWQIMLASVGVAGTAALTFFGIKAFRRYHGFQLLPAAVMLSAGYARATSLESANKSFELITTESTNKSSELIAIESANKSFELIAIGSRGKSFKLITTESGSESSGVITAVACYQPPEPPVLTIYPTKIIGAGGRGVLGGVCMAICNRMFERETFMTRYVLRPLMEPTFLGIASVALGYPIISTPMLAMQAAQFLILNGMMRGALQCLGDRQVNQFLISLALYLTLHWCEEGMDDLNFSSKVINCILQTCAWIAGYVGGTHLVDCVARRVNPSQESGQTSNESSNHDSSRFFRLEESTGWRRINGLVENQHQHNKNVC